MYNCFEWINGWYLNVSVVSSTTGYRKVLSSRIYVGFNPNGTSMNMTTIYSAFNLNSFFVCAAYQNSLHLSIQGIRNNNYMIYYQDIIINTHPKTQLTFNWTNLTTINFQSYYYDTTLNQNLTGLGYQFAIDNINVTFN
jgi:hypothetical protein